MKRTRTQLTALILLISAGAAIVHASLVSAQSDSQGAPAPITPSNIQVPPSAINPYSNVSIVSQVTSPVDNSAPTTPAAPVTSTDKLQNPLSNINSIGQLVNSFTAIFSYIVVLFAVLALIWVGLQFILAQGNPSKLKDCKKWLTWIVIGVAVVIGARIIVEVVINTFSATGSVSPTVIQNAQSALQGN